MGAWATAGQAASSDVVVTADIVSSTTLVNDCTAPSAAGFGIVQPSTNARTATGAGVCRVTFGSSQPAQLRIGQSDGTGTAMGFGIVAPVEQTGYIAPGRTLGVFGHDATTAFAVGRASTGYRTTDGGATWYAMDNSPVPNNWDVETTPGDPTTVWVVGENRSFYRSTNALAVPASSVTFTNLSGGLTTAGWPGAADVNELTVPDTNTIYAVGEQRRLGKYDIGAGTWQSFQHTDSSFATLVSVDALNATTVMAVSMNGTVLRTTNGTMSSANWSASTLPSPPSEVTDVAYASATRAYAVGFDGYLAVWNGTTWTDRSASLAMPRDLIGVDSIPGSPDSLLVLDGSGLVHRSTDAGLTWTHAPTGSGSRAGDIHATTATAAYVAGAERSFSGSSTGGASWFLNGPGAGTEEIGAVDAAPLNGRRIVAVGATAKVTFNGGGNWFTRPTGVAHALRGVSLGSDDVGWAVGDGPSIVRTTDLGWNWTTQAAPGGVASLTDVVALDEQRALAVGMDGAIIGTTNASTWTTRASGTTHTLSGITAFGDLVLAVGARGTVLRSTNAGGTWTAVPGGSLPSATADLLDVVLAGPDVAYAITRTQVWRSSDAGLTWTLASTLSSTRMRAVAASGRTVVVAGFDDRVAWSTDNGATFTEQAAGTASTMHLSSVTMVDPHTAMIGAADSRRLRMDVDPAPTVQIPDWTATTNDWDSGGFFGVCLQDAAGGAIADWTEDVTNVAGQCEALDSDPWRAVPATASIAAHTATAGSGSVDLVWGLRPEATQAQGTYEAGVSFEALAP